MSEIAIKIENLSKIYQLGQIGSGTISQDFERWLAKVRGKEDPFLKIGESNDQHVKGESNIVWSLKDINLEIKQGETVGIIGRNGAGKSTLLKILSKVTAPTTGKIVGYGRIASLLEVGTGFHPELSGRENIFLNGAILGMRRKEIQRKLDEIVDFAGIDRYLDTPVKRYSSGMYVRLAFSVAANLQSEILIVDEVLAVGDAEFQKKCMGKMDEVSKKEGRTVLFVSHNMESIKKLCSNGILLSNGEMVIKDNINATMEKYLSLSNKISSIIFENHKMSVATILKVEFRNLTDIPISEIEIANPWKIYLEFEVNESVKDLVCAIGITNLLGLPINTSWHRPLTLEPGICEAEFIQDSIDLALGSYNVQVGLSQDKKNIQFIEDAIQFEVVYTPTLIHGNRLKLESNTGAIINEMKSSIKRKNYYDKKNI
ncbi:ABC transporter ATP-binding protein [Pedobacter frigidisoli]|uniref:ABC transporter ATP-binding protein n=1 Tax=Pedobacter frigidisoli TaxID=2530455 RepID=UPI00292E3E99|nr:ABC transporter ATP-binding protein [Pedobacter frigidisoli]